MSSRGLVLALMVILVLLIPGIYAIDFSLTGCGSEGRFSDKTNLFAPKEADVFVYSTIKEGNLGQVGISHGIRNLHKIYTADSNNEEHAEISVDINNAKFLTYDKPAKVETSTSASLSDFTLSAIDAEKIKCAAAASNRFEDKASVSIQIDDGSLINYRASAYAQATPNADHSAFASQQIGLSGGKKIRLNAEASDRELNHKAEASTEVREGSIANFNSETACSRMVIDPYLNLYAIHGAFTPNLPGYISGKAITSEGTAIGPTNLKASYKTTITDGSIGGFFDQGTQLINDEVIAISLEAPANWEDWQGPPYNEMKDNIVIAKKIEFESSASEGSGLASSESTKASNVFIGNWLGSGSFASPGNAWSQKDYEVLLGRKVVITP
jgi:hypothetical protein